MSTPERSLPLRAVERPDAQLYWPRRAWYRRLLTPPGLWRVDRLLVTNFPLLWRSRLLYFVAGSTLIANSVLRWLGESIPVDATSLPTVDNVLTLTTTLYVVAAILLLAWAYTQVRTPVYEMRWRRYAALSLAYAGCIFTVLLNPLTLVHAVVPRMAEVVPDAGFREELAFHEGNDFWVCSGSLTVERFLASRPRIVEALGTYGLRTDVELDDAGMVAYCANGGASVVYAGGFGVIGLESRMRAVAAAKEAVASETGAFAGYYGAVPRLAVLSLLLGGLLTLIVCHRIALWRLLDARGIRVSLPDARPLQPKWLVRLDSWLVERHPLVWSTRIHTFIYHAATLGTVFVVLLVGAATLAGTDSVTDPLDVLAEQFGEVAGLSALFLFGAALAAAWAVYQRRVELKACGVRANQRALLAYVAICSTVPLMTVLGLSLAIRDAEEIAGLGIFVLTGSWFVATTVYVSKHLPTRRTALALALSTGATVATLAVGLVFQGGVEAVGFVLSVAWLIVAGVLRRRARRGFGTPTSLLAATSMLYLPTVLFFIMVTLSELMNDGGLGVVSVSIWVVLSALTFAYLTGPATRVFLRARFWPQPE